MVERYIAKWCGRLTLLLGLAVPLAAPAATALPAATTDASVFEAVREADGRLADIGYRLARANVALCDRREPGLGLQLHTLDQFDDANRAAAARHFSFAAPVAVETVVAGSPAARAGIRPDDSLVRVGSIDTAALPGHPNTTERLVAAQLAIAALPVDAPVVISAIRGGAPITLTVAPEPICRTRFELRLGQDFNASADGTMVQVSARFLQAYPEPQFAAVVAHEFAHNILHHRDRLAARGVDYGLLSGFGTNVKYFRQTEIEADLLSVYLLANAGIDPRAAVDFWRHFGPSRAGGIFRSRSHPGWRDRVATLNAEIGRIAVDAPRPIVPPLVAVRDRPLDGDWQALLVRAR